MVVVVRRFLQVEQTVGLSTWITVEIELLIQYKIVSRTHSCENQPYVVSG